MSFFVTQMRSFVRFYFLPLLLNPHVDLSLQKLFLILISNVKLYITLSRNTTLCPPELVITQKSWPARQWYISPNLSCIT